MRTVEASLFLLFFLLQEVTDATVSFPCAPKYVSPGDMVCVCNATYCDMMGPLSLPPEGTFVKYLSSKAGKRLERREGKLLANRRRSGLLYSYNPCVQYQCMKGFGGSHTDAVAINIMQLSPAAQERLLRSYFSEDGIEYNLLRLPIGFSDFSTHPYSYDDDCPDDFELKCFSLAQEDTKFRIPLLQRMLALSKRPLSLVASPWSSPGWMRLNGNVEGKSKLKGKAGDRYHKTWARYFIRFLDEYARHNITFWAVTPQNEPVSAVLLPSSEFPVNSYTAEEMRDFIILDLGPELAASSHKDVLLIVLDDQRTYVLDWAKVILGNSSSARYVAGIGFHWYMDPMTLPSLTVEPAHSLFPNYFLLYTEFCNGYGPIDVVLGSWDRGVRYSQSILENISRHFVGWIDWNLALDMRGGPNFIKNFVDSPIIVNAAKDEFYKQPMFYHLAHFSKFIPEGSVRVLLACNSLLGNCQLQTEGFLRPDGVAVVVVLNKCFLSVPFSISDEQLGYIEDVAPANSIQTYLWKTSGACLGGKGQGKCLLPTK
ncbi:lysosomal acid glucosylceramidase-like [Lacerta agilis]|uniref:lysosomal acid glucosylceramidase-like n=1 Tax=Lacerta agilis TaxID=80427 RepID=UPI001419B254|nr:lysosomal acid glucosylceramidase-like [Lacerta agilis]